MVVPNLYTVIQMKGEVHRAMRLFKIDDTRLFTCCLFQNIFYKKCFTWMILLIYRSVAIKLNI